MADITMDIVDAVVGTDTVVVAGVAAVVEIEEGHLPPNDIWPPASKRFGKATSVTVHKESSPIISWHMHIPSIAMIILGAIVSTASGNRLFFIALGVSALALLIRQALQDVTMDISSVGSIGNGFDGTYNEWTWQQRLQWIWTQLGKWWDSIDFSDGD